METIDIAYVESFVTWQAGDWFDRRQLDRLRTDLLATGLFESVSIRRDSELDADGELPIHLVLKEGKHRSIGLEGYWSTDEGLGGEVTWEHRNLAGRQERLTTSLRLEEVRQELDIRFRKPRFLAERQTLLASVQLSVEDTDAYQGSLINGALGLDRRLGQYWTASGSLWAEASELEDYLGERRFDLQGLELDLRRNSANDPLDPSRGWRMDLALLPYHISGDDNLDVLQGTLGLRGYLPLGKQSGPIIAVRAKFGTIVDQDPEVLPANRRFYAGGGSSIRGYALQSVGPVTDSGQPTGGNALVELGAELRFRFSESLGGVLFAEGGNVFEDSKPDPTRELRWAAGAGLRFFTAVGPVRLDVGVPIDPRDSDDDFQFYISVGQAF
jgi:translocation and assembly module TamA